uniref:NACHT domain-containing protein n=1 Tax=Oryzias sinensis TaxID=183150 RepID=A0A8C7Y624_9TELE
MDDESNLQDKDVNAVLAQESSKLCHILSNQSQSVIMLLYQRMVNDDGWQSKQASSSSNAGSSADLVKSLLDYYRSANAAKCRNFLQSVCMLCEDIPMHLEARLMSVACSEYEQLWSFSTASANVNLLLSRWKRLTDRLVKAVELDRVWVNFRNVNRGRDRPDQTPASADRGFNSAEPDGDYGFSESKVTMETFLRGCKGKVTFLVGQAGSGKTLLMSCLGQQWAKGLGPFPASYLFVFLEFRQLNQLSRSLSLSELLFQHYLPSNRGNNAEKAIVDCLLSNPEKSCWVLDGYDEFLWKIKKHRMPRDVLNLEEPLPVADLISGLLTRQLLPGSTVVVTCRARDIVDFYNLSDKVGELLEWDQNEIKEYVHHFFGVEDRAIGVEATKLLLSSQHLLAMSSLPALCNICCICLKHLLLTDRNASYRSAEDEPRGKATKNKIQTKEMDMQVVEKDKGTEREENETQNAQHSGEREGSQDLTMRTANGELNFSATSAQVPSTLTQVYLTAVAAFLSRLPDQGGGDNRPKAARSSLSMLPTFVQYPSELCELSQVAWKGVEEGKILFMKEDVPETILQLLVKSGLFSQVELRCHDGTLVNAYSFIHLTVQEFLAALRIMTSHKVSDAQLKKRFSLKTRWTTKSDQKTPFTDSLYLYVCGLASPNCTQVLVEVARASGVKGVQNWVQKRQDLVLRLLRPLCHSNTLTGPKLLQLCNCIQESQDYELAQQALRARPTLELRNFRLVPNDIDALAFVVNSAADQAVGLDFGACSMEPECLDALSRCQCIHFLSFHSRKYNDKFAEKLSSILPGFPNLRKLEFSGASLTAAGAKGLASGLQKCCNITEINLSDNNLQDDGIGHVVELFTKLPNLSSVKLGRNNSSLQALNCIVEKMGSCLNILQVYADGVKEVVVTFSKESDAYHLLSFSLLNQKWNKLEMQNLVKSLVNCPALSVLELQNPVQASLVFAGGTENPSSEISKTLCLSCCKLVPAHLERVWQSLRTTSGLTQLNLSSNCLGDKGLKKLLDILPHLDKIQEINASNNDLSMEGAVMLAGALCSHNHLTQVQIRYFLIHLLLFFCYFFYHNENHCYIVRNCSLQQDHLIRLAEIVSNCPSLSKIDFSLDRLDIEEHQFLCSLLPLLPNLTSLRIYPSVFSTELGFCNLNDGVREWRAVIGVSIFLCSMSHCVWSPAAELQVIEALQQSITLQSLCLDCVQLSEGGWTALAQVLKNSNCIRSLRLDEIVKEAGQTEADRMLDLLTVMEGNKQIEEIGLDAWRMSEGGIQQLTHFLPDWKELKIICLSKNFMGDTAGERLLDALKSCIHLRELHLSSNDLGDLTAARMSLVLPSLTHLTVLDISENHLGRDGAAALSTAIRSLKKLTQINLTAVGTSELSLVAASLAECPLIQDVGLGWNGCGDDVALQLSGLLPFCPKLVRIDLECNLIGVSGVETLVKASWTCPSLQVIRLWKNKVPLNEQQRLMLKDRRLTFSST